MLSVTLETVMIALYAGTTNGAGLSMGVFFSFCFITFYGGGIDVVGYVYCSKSRKGAAKEKKSILIIARRDLPNAYPSSRRRLVPCRYIHLYFDLC